MSATLQHFYQITCYNFIIIIIIISTINFVDCFPTNNNQLLRTKRAFSYIANETACTVDHIVYKDGDPIPTDDPCETCRCRPPGFTCVLKHCEVKTGCRAIRHLGECCPSYQCGCEHNGQYYQDGERIYNAESPCYSCYCQGSSITCSLADCQFRFDCEPEYVLGECCPRYDHCPPESNKLLSVMMKNSNKNNNHQQISTNISTTSNPLVISTTLNESLTEAYWISSILNTEPSLTGTNSKENSTEISSTIAPTLIANGSALVQEFQHNKLNESTSMMNGTESSPPGTILPENEGKDEEQVTTEKSLQQINLTNINYINNNLDNSPITATTTILPETGTLPDNQIETETLNYSTTTTTTEPTITTELNSLNKDLQSFDNKIKSNQTFQLRKQNPTTESLDLINESNVNTENPLMNHGNDEMVTFAPSEMVETTTESQIITFPPDDN